jgi:hypothetical protein
MQRLLSDFAWHADRGDGAALGALFLPTGALLVGGQELVGPEEIAADCYRRFQNPQRKTRHMWSNLRLDQVDTDAATATAVQLTFEQAALDQPTQLRVNDVFDTFAKDPAGRWRFARRVVQREMALTL